MGKVKAVNERCQRKRCAAFAPREVNLPAELGEGFRNIGRIGPMGPMALMNGRGAHELLRERWLA